MKKIYYLLLFLTIGSLSVNASYSSLRIASRNQAPAFAAESQNTRLEVVLYEDFSKFTEGSQDAPAENPLPTDWYGSFDESKVNVKGWGGNHVHEAGGCAFISAEGLMWSPTIDMTGASDNTVVVSFRARKGDDVTEGGVPSVTMGYGKPFECDPLTSEWHDYKVNIPGAYSGADFTFKCTSDWLIDDVKVEKSVYYLDVPVGLTFSEYVVDGFRAIWQPVQGAAYYLVDVFEVDDLTQKLTKVQSDLKTEETNLVVTGLPESDNLFCFCVTAVDASGHKSDSSVRLLVEALLTPQITDAKNVTANGFTASWEAVDGALCYDFYVYREVTAPSAGRVPVVDTDFGFITSSTSSAEESVSFDALPGWVINVPLFEEGAIGMDGARAAIENTMFASMESPAYDFSSGDGSVEITISVRGTRGAKVTFSLFTMKNGTYPVYPESYFAVENLPFEDYEERTFTLTGGGKSSVIYIETVDWEQAWISDLKISQSVNAGETVIIPLVNFITVENSVDVSDVNLTDGNRHFFIVRAVGISRDDEYYIGSDFTAPHYVSYETTGITDGRLTGASVKMDGDIVVVNNPALSPVTVYDLSGAIVFDSAAPVHSLNIPISAQGVYLVRVGAEMFKIMR